MNDSKSNISGLALLAAVGLLIAGGTFLFTFITTQKARTADPRTNLRIPIASIPAPASILPREVPLRIQVQVPPSPVATTSSEQSESSIEPTTQPILSPLPSESPTQ